MNNMKIIIKSFMQGYFHSLKSLFDVLQVVGVICNYLNNSSSCSLIKSKTQSFIILENLELSIGNIHTQSVTQNVKITLSVQPHPRTPENVRWDQIFFCCKTSNIGTIGNRETAKDLPSMP